MTPERRPSNKPRSERRAAAKRLLDVEHTEHRLQLFREWLARNVCLASPLLLDACAARRLDIAMWRLTPSDEWPAKVGVSTLLNGLENKGHPGVSAWGRTPLAQDAYGARHIILHIDGRSAHMEMRVGPTLIRTSDRGGSVILPISSAVERYDLIGSPLSSAVKHPITQDRRYLITGIGHHPATGRQMIDFMANPEQWRVPWARPR
ncbi:hypothetical protein [Novosphingobium terrae]|uniref:hypothetical protein n=1 Tax=Novosphingobium terrae TaxID=2726189 RepID=UPI001981A3B3|nr:hypothetical protein [Novosphingobium terrae]